MLNLNSCILNASPPSIFSIQSHQSHLVCSISQIDAIADDASWYGCRHNDDVSTHLISDRILSNSDTYIGRDIWRLLPRFRWFNPHGAKNH